MTKNNQTLLIIKPNAVKKNVSGEIISIIENNNIKIINIKMLQLNENEAKIFYKEHDKKPFYQELITFITSGSIIALILKGDNVISKVRDLIGHTDFKKAKKGTIREKFADSLTENAVHASDSFNSFSKEKDIIFHN